MFNTLQHLVSKNESCMMNLEIAGFKHVTNVWYGHFSSTPLYYHQKYIMMHKDPAISCFLANKKQNDEKTGRLQSQNMMNKVNLFREQLEVF